MMRGYDISHQIEKKNLDSGWTFIKLKANKRKKI